MESERACDGEIAATSTHDYWFAEVAPPFRRLQYGFILTGADDRDTFTEAMVHVRLPGKRRI
ncbi:alpha amylase N-terminal ig-like domain-containing protein [Bacillus licheniformis]|nr:alpha amylase N-terminal ig-like domain-containing protein [Bacillus licheniformis]